MVDWKKYEVPDWVVDDYNSRVSEADRIPLGSYGAGNSHDDCDSENVKIPMAQYGSYQKDKKGVEVDSQINEDDIEGLIGLVITLSIAFGLIVLVTACK